VGLPSRSEIDDRLWAEIDDRPALKDNLYVLHTGIASALVECDPAFARR
jgi:hypothetical protein